MHRLTPRFANILRALRAGPLDSDQCVARGFHATDLCTAVRAGWVAAEARGACHRRYSLTAAGLAACPPRNPASARPRATPTQGSHVRGPSPQHRGRATLAAMLTPLI